MRLKPVLAAVSVVLLFGAIGCSSSDAPKEIEGSGTTVDGSPTTEETQDSTTTTEETDGSTTTTEVASGAGCPTADEAAQIETVGETVFAGTVNDESIASVLAVYAIVQPYLPADLQDDYETATRALPVALAKVEGLNFKDLNDPSALAPEDQARVEAYKATLEAPEVDAAGSAVDDYFDDACPDLDF